VTRLITFKVHEDPILPAPRPALAAGITFLSRSGFPFLRWPRPCRQHRTVETTLDARHGDVVEVLCNGEQDFLFCRNDVDYFGNFNWF
jgi:hypothetical protein